MPQFQTGRALLAALRERLDDWVSAARAEAYAEQFAGDDAAVTDAELRQIDRVDSWMSRERGRGLWGADEYGIVATGTLEEESTPHVVCTYHPQLPEYALGDEGLDDETREAIDEALWDYCERVVELVQADVEEFVWSSEVATWQE